MESLVIIPTFNEVDNIEEVIRTVMALPLRIDVLVVDDNSPDCTAEEVDKLVNEFPGRVFIEVRKEKSGLGTAYLHGFNKALEWGYQYIFEMDADNSHNPRDLVRLHRTCAIEGYDLAIGSRYVRGVNVVNWPLSRMLMSIFASYYVRLITRMSITDSTAGFKCYKRIVLETIELDKIRFIGYAFQIEMKFLTWKYGFKIKEIPIIFTDRSKGESKMSTGIFKEAFLGVIQMKVRSFFKTYSPNINNS